MPTTALNFNFLAPVLTEILRGFQNKNWALLISSDAPLADKFSHVAIVPVYAYQRTKFKLFRSISFWDIRRVPL